MAGHLQISPNTVAFGPTLLTSTAAQTLTLTNSGNAPVASLAFTLGGTNAADFTLSSTTCLPAGLAVGANCTAQVTFAPSISGPRIATLSITSNDPASPLTIPLSGTGSLPPGFTLSVNGGSTGAATVNSGASAIFGLILTPQGGYNGTVTLACKALAPAPNADCVLGSTQLGPLTGPATSSATVVTLSGISSSLALPFGLISCGSLAAFSTRKRLPQSRLVLSTLATVSLLWTAASLSGCGGGSASIGHPYTPPGTYQYQVTAAATTGTALSSTVVLTVIVQ